MLEIGVLDEEKYCKVKALGEIGWAKKSLIEEKYIVSLLEFYEKFIIVMNSVE